MNKDKILSWFGLVTNKKYDTTQESWVQYTKLLGAAAKEKGVEVVLDFQKLENIHIDSDIFVIGCSNLIENVSVDKELRFSPNCKYNVIRGITRTSTVYGNRVTSCECKAAEVKY